MSAPRDRMIASAAAILFVLLPPLSDAAGQLFAAHMLQHLLLIAVAAPLLVASGALENFSRRMAWSNRPLIAWALFVGTFLFWHWPVAFRWAARSEASELLEHGSIFLTAVVFWSVALMRGRRERAFSDGARALFVMTAAIVTDLPGVVMLFASRAICAMPGENAAAFGVTPLEDQQIAGLLMWVPANLVFFGVATFLFARWLSDEDRLPETS